jgi:hypothetical protein
MVCQGNPYWITGKGRGRGTRFYPKYEENPCVLSWKGTLGPEDQDPQELLPLTNPILDTLKYIDRYGYQIHCTA